VNASQSSENDELDGERAEEPDEGDGRTELEGRNARFACAERAINACRKLYTKKIQSYHSPFS
jgi:hypothetical protein